MLDRYACNIAVAFRQEDWDKILCPVVKRDGTLTNFFAYEPYDKIHGSYYEVGVDKETDRIDYLVFRWYHKRGWKQSIAAKKLYQLLKLTKHDLIICGEKPSDIYVHKDLNVLFLQQAYPAVKGEFGIKQTRDTMNRIIKLAAEHDVPLSEIAKCFPVNGYEYVAKILHLNMSIFRKECC